MSAVMTRMTAEQFLALPDTPGKQEFLNGELISLPPAKLLHDDIAIRYQERLLPMFEQGRVRKETGYRLRSGWLQPDVSVTYRDQRRGEWLEGAPMIAIEIASRGNTDDEIDAKISAYLNEGSSEVWIVRPKTVSMTVYKPDGSASRHTGIYTSSLLSAEIDVAALING
jgi:Uma2 family endonuclease